MSAAGGREARERRRGGRRPKLSLRYRLIALALLPMLVVAPILIGGTMYRWWGKFDSLLITKVNGDLTIAHQYLSQLVENTGERIQALGDSAEFARLIERGDSAALEAWLARSREALGLDFLYLRAPKGGLRAASPAGMRPQGAGEWPIIEEARRSGVATAIDLFTGEQLAAIDGALAHRARVELVPTKAARADRPFRRDPGNGYPCGGGSWGGRSRGGGGGVARHARRWAAAQPESRLHRYDQ